jgi:hypothetical protein
MLWQCENKCRPPREVQDGQRVICGHCKAKYEPPEVKKAPGVGTILKGFRRMQIASIVIGMTGGTCMCTQIATKMDRLGPDGCEQYFDELIEDLRESAKVAGIPFWERQIRQMLKAAIRRARASA